MDGQTDRRTNGQRDRQRERDTVIYSILYRQIDQIGLDWIGLDQVRIYQTWLDYIDQISLPQSRQIDRQIDNQIRLDQIRLYRLDQIRLDQIR